MMRHLLSLLGGVVLAVGLFWLLAQLVAPPEREPEELTMSMAMTMIEAPEVAPEQEAPTPQPVEAAPQQAPPPMPAPEPPPVAESTISLPEVELPEEPVEPVEMDSELPELTEVEPEPRPEPTPEPTPEPPPREAPAEPAPAATTAEPSEPAEREAAPAAEPAPSNEPVSVGQATPTSRVNPNYPPRAQRRGMEGFVEVAFTIRRDGSVDSSSIRVTNAQPRRVFDDAARDAIAKWQFEPSDQLRNATQRIEFQLR
ncbi:TonB family protein [Halomonas sp. FeN2]|uniref:Protein TonB n=1 Tax=Vreelandella neptunia TaxID=115551 RepID=A0ABZ0YRP7_9GAMM|nr:MULTISPECIES: energy transducer TonB [Halomonas]TDV99365.1 protein TonB [Halomonas alkaliantarctica]MBF56224.1 iron transporter [Halomonas sp.]MDN3561845.1 TonB family protein [Halomonas neptunia]UBR49650.1 TonB family protein [Halomonas sp. FeN2]WQH14433.1 TonB family protein [Halomonas neptunia]|tara:strand:- start:323 stop:1090 length:768 start_codon:yes stop_codon:yes gene_type:complete